MKNEKKLLLLNGRWNFGNGSHIYIAAYSVADACRICNEVVGYESNWRNEINIYFSKGCWGRLMDGIEPERGAWVSEHRYDKPERVYPKTELRGTK